MDLKTLENFMVDQNASLAEALRRIDANSHGVVFVVDKGKHLVGAVSDGDIRRWILKSGSIDTEVCQFMNEHPISILSDGRSQATTIMKKKQIHVLPVVDQRGIILDLCMENNSMPYEKAKGSSLAEVTAVIMAGGKGTRLYPFTKILPKPLIPIGEIPIVERVMDTFRDFGVKDFLMTVNYKKNMIQSYFADAEKDYTIEYVEEDKPLGTGGSLGLIRRTFNEPVFVANCDCLIKADYAELYQYHIDSENAITLVTSMKNETIPYGVIHSGKDGELESMVEKPTMSYLINTGMYIINPDMISLIPENTMFHMTNLVEKAMKLGYKVGMYPVSEDSFLDMGEFSEMKRMEEKMNIR